MTYLKALLQPSIWYDIFYQWDTDVSYTASASLNTDNTVYLIIIEVEGSAIHTVQLNKKHTT